MGSVAKAIPRRMSRSSSAPRATDGQLLEQFAQFQDKAAFEELVRRHGPMVLRVCKQVLDNDSDAEDAFQATFIVLMGKASSIAKRESVGSWLHGVAFRVAVHARRNSHKFRASQADACRGAIEDPRPTLKIETEVRQMLNEELSRLPEKYRAPLVLCYVQGKATEEVARQFGCPIGTLKWRLAQARELLRTRLMRRGLPAVIK